MANITGTLGADQIAPGLAFNGTIPDLTVDDVINGDTGSDVIAASTGNDSLIGGLGDDILFGNQGIDTLFGGGDNDSLFGGKDNDVLEGEAGNDIMHGDLGTDIVRGGDGNDAIGSNEGNDTLYGGAGNDTFFGGKDQDSIFGDAGDDVISGDIGGDIVSGGTGNDTFILGRNANGTTTGGATTAEADVLKDFKRGEDKLQLTETQKFSELTFVASGGNTIIQDKVSSEFLAVVEGVTNLDATDFKATTQPAGAAGSIEFSAVAYTGKEAAAGSPSPNRVTITVNRVGGSTGAVTVNYNTAAGVQNPAEAAVDYTEVTNGVLSWADGDTAPKTFEVLLPSDGTTNVVEQAETFSLVLSTPTNGAVLGTKQTAVVTINDGAAADTGAAPKLVGAELLVGDAAGSSLGKVKADGATSYNIKGSTSDAGATVENAITIDASGNLTLTAAGATALNSVKYLDVKVATDKGAESTIRVYGNIDNAVKDSIIGDVMDISDGTGKNAIKVGSGAYAEDVFVNKEVVLKGAAFGTPGIATRSEESKLAGVMSVQAGADNSTIDGFTFDSSSRVNVAAILDKLTVSNNVFSKQTASAVNATVAATNLTVSNNLFDANTAIGVNLSKVASATVTGNTFRGFTGGANVDAISVVDLVEKVTISNNSIETFGQAGRGVDFSATAVVPTGTVLISRNTIKNTGGAGVSVDVVPAGPLTAAVTISGNTITSASQTAAIEEGGIRLKQTVANNFGTNLVSATGNDLNQNIGGGVNVSGVALNLATALKVTGNNLDTNLSNTTPTVAVGGLGINFLVDPTLAGAVNATGNFWGVGTPKMSSTGVGDGNIFMTAAPTGGDPTIISPDGAGVKSVDFGNALLAAV